jgi:hypothetical protein
MGKSGGKATSVPFSGGNKNHGDFRIKKFNIFDTEEMEIYADLRTQANNASSGIVIEQIREYTKEFTEREGRGEDAIVTTTKDIYLVVHFWEKKPKRENGDSDDEVKEAKKSWSVERSAS